MKTKKEKKKGFFKWLFSKWHYWVLSVVWGFLSSWQSIFLGFYEEVFGTIIGTLIITGLIYLIIFSIRNSMRKKIEAEIESKMKNKS